MLGDLTKVSGLRDLGAEQEERYGHELAVVRSELYQSALCQVSLGKSPTAQGLPEATAQGHHLEGDESRGAAGVEGNCRGLVGPGDITQQYGRSLWVGEHHRELWLEVFHSWMSVFSMA